MTPPTNGAALTVNVMAIPESIFRQIPSRPVAHIAVFHPNFDDDAELTTARRHFRDKTQFRAICAKKRTVIPTCVPCANIIKYLVFPRKNTNFSLTSLLRICYFCPRIEPERKGYE